MDGCQIPGDLRTWLLFSQTLAVLSDIPYPSTFLCSQMPRTFWPGAGSGELETLSRSTDQTALADQQDGFELGHRSGTPKSGSHRRTFPVPVRI